MKKRSSSRKKTPVDLWVALIGLFGVLVAAILSSPVVLELIKQEPVPKDTQTVVITPTFQVVSSQTTPTENNKPNSTSQAIVCITAQNGEGTSAKVLADSLVYSSSYFGQLKELPLMGGLKIPFNSIKSLDATGIYETGGVKVEIILTNGEVVTDVVESSQYDGSKLTGSTEFGEFELRFLDVKRVEFREGESCQ